MRELFVDVSNGYPKCYWRDSRCKEGKGFVLKQGLINAFYQ